MSEFVWPFGPLEQFIQIATNPGIDAGSLVSKDDKRQLAEAGLVTPTYGGSFHLTPLGEHVWQELRRIISYTDPWTVAQR